MKPQYGGCSARKAHIQKTSSLDGCEIGMEHRVQYLSCKLPESTNNLATHQCLVELNWPDVNAGNSSQALKVCSGAHSKGSRRQIASRASSLTLSIGSSCDESTPRPVRVRSPLQRTCSGPYHSNLHRYRAGLSAVRRSKPGRVASTHFLQCAKRHSSDLQLRSADTISWQYSCAFLQGDFITL